MAKIKDKADPAQEQQTEAPPIDIQQDEYRGQGGSYVFDAATGKRTRIGTAAANNDVPESPAIDKTED